MHRQVVCPKCKTEAFFRDVPVLDSVEILAEYTDGSTVTAPSATTVMAVVCPNCSAFVFLTVPVDRSAIPRAWLPVRDAQAFALALKALNCSPGKVELQWHLACIRLMNEVLRTPSLLVDAPKSQEWIYLNQWVANFANLEYADDATDIAEAYRRLGRFEESLLCLEKGKTVDRTRAKKIEILAIAQRTELAEV